MPLKFLIGLAIGGVIIVLMAHCLSWLRTRDSKDEEEQDRRRSEEKKKRYEDKKTALGDVIATHIEALNDQFYAQHKDQRRNERVNTFIQIFTVISAVGAAGLAFWSALIFQGQLTEMRNEQRAWVRDASVTINKLSVQKDQVLVWVTFNFANIGKSPARSVSVIPKLLIPALEPWGFRRAKTSCDEAKQSSKLVVGNALFPDEPGSQTINFGRPMTDIQRGQKAAIKEGYDMWAQAWGKKEADNFLPSLIKMNAYMTFSIVGCIAYTIGDSPIIHGTSFSFGLTLDPDHPEIDGDTRSGAINVSKVGDIDGKELRLTRDLLGRYAD
jgi:hypothetical protein